MPADRPERPRDDRNSPYGRSRDDRRRARSRSRSWEREKEWGYDRAPRERSPPIRRSRSPEQTLNRDPRRRPSGSRSPLPPRDDRDREKQPSSRNEGLSRGSSPSRSPGRNRRSSPSPPPPSNDAPRYRRDYSSGYRHPSYHDGSQHGYDNSNRGRGWRGSYNPRGGYQQRHFDGPHIRVNDGNYNPPQRTPPSTAPNYQSNPNSEPAKPVPQTSSTTASDQTPIDPAVPAGPASWRRAQQYRQERPYQQDYRQNYSHGRGAPPTNQLHRNSPRQPYPQSPATAVSPHDPPSHSPTFHRSSVPTGPRALARNDSQIKKEYISPVADLEEQVSSFLRFANL